MEQEIKVSVIVPVYNVRRYLGQCVDSLLAQTLQEIEIILVDDGSTDGSGKLCDSYAGADARIRVIHKENGGLASARNAGLRAARGRYLGFVDGDDWVSPRMFETLYQNAREFCAQISGCHFQEVENPGQVRACEVERREIHGTSEMLQLFFLRKISESVCDKIFASELWKDRVFAEGEINEDTVVVFGLLAQSERTVMSSLELYYYRTRPGSITKSGYSEKFRIVDAHLAWIQKELKDRFPELLPYMRHFFSVHYYCLLLSVLKNDTRNAYREDYRHYETRFFKLFPEFMKWGTGKQKDRILALVLRCHCGFLIRWLERGK